MIQKIRRLAASLGIYSRPPLGDAAAGARLMMRGAEASKIPAAQVQGIDRR
jgi:hypothetical protein